MSKCVNINSEEFKHLASQTPVNPALLASMVSIWMDLHKEEDRFPSLYELGVPLYGEEEYTSGVPSKEIEKFKFEDFSNYPFDTEFVRTEINVPKNFMNENYAESSDEIPSFFEIKKVAVSRMLESLFDKEVSHLVMKRLIPDALLESKDSKILYKTLSDLFKELSRFRSAILPIKRLSVEVLEKKLSEIERTLDKFSEYSKNPTVSYSEFLNSVSEDLNKASEILESLKVPVFLYLNVKDVQKANKKDIQRLFKYLSIVKEEIELKIKILERDSETIIENSAKSLISLKNAIIFISKSEDFEKIWQENIQKAREFVTRSLDRSREKSKELLQLLYENTQGVRYGKGTSVLLDEEKYKEFESKIKKYFPEWSRGKTVTYTVKEVLEKIGSMTEDPERRKIARIFLDNFQDLDKTQVVFLNTFGDITREVSGMYAMTPFIYRTTEGKLYASHIGKVYINTASSYFYSDPESLIFHEVTHSLSPLLLYYKMKNPHYDVLKEIIDHAKKYLSENFEIPTSILEKNYALRNPAEFVAEFFSNSELHKILRFVPPLRSRGFLDLLTQLLDILGQLIGISNYKNLYEQTFEILENLINEREYEFSEIGQIKQGANLDLEKFYFEPSDAGEFFAREKNLEELRKFVNTIKKFNLPVEEFAHFLDISFYVSYQDLRGFFYEYISQTITRWEIALNKVGEYIKSVGQISPSDPFILYFTEDKQFKFSSLEEYERFKSKIIDAVYEKYLKNITIEDFILELEKKELGSIYLPEISSFSKSGENKEISLKDFGNYFWEDGFYVSEYLSIIDPDFTPGNELNFSLPRNFVYFSENRTSSIISGLNIDKNKKEQKLSDFLEINKDLVEQILPVLKALNSSKMKGIIVGGAVRDALLGKTPKDLDIEVYNTSIQDLENYLKRYGVVDSVGKSFGILKFKTFDSVANIVSEVKDISQNGPALFLPIGIPGSGKSTWIKKNILENKNFSPSSFVIVSPDEIRKELTGDISDQSKNAEVFEEAKKRASEALNKGKIVIFDATNLNTENRLSLIGDILSLVKSPDIYENITKNIYYKIFDSSPEVSGERIRKDIEQSVDRSNVPQNVIERFYEVYKTSVRIIENAQNLEEAFDFSVPRRESRIGKGHKGFKTEFDKSISVEEASSRRDFTINSIGYDPVNNILYDYFGGVSDLENGIIRHISEKFSEDPLRILRAMQFQGRMDFRIAPETYKLIKNMVEEGVLDELPKERIVGEWMKWAIKSVNPGTLFEFLRESGIGDKYFPELMKLKNTPQDPVFHPEGDVEIHTSQVMYMASRIAEREKLNNKEKAILIFSALLHDVAKPNVTKYEFSKKYNREIITSKGHEALSAEMVPEILSRIGVQEEIIEKIVPIVREHLAHATISAIPGEKQKMSAFSKLVSRLNKASVYQLMLLMEADMKGRNKKFEDNIDTINEFQSLLDKYKSIYGSKAEKQLPILQGKHLIQKGVPPGPVFKKILSDAYEAQLSFEFSNEDEAIVWLGKYLDYINNSTANVIGQHAAMAYRALIDIVITDSTTILPYDYAPFYIRIFSTVKDKIIQNMLSRFGNDPDALADAVYRDEDNGEMKKWWEAFSKWILAKYRKLDKEKLNYEILNSIYSRGNIAEERRSTSPSISEEDVSFSISKEKVSENKSPKFSYFEFTQILSGKDAIPIYSEEQLPKHVYNLIASKGNLGKVKGIFVKGEGIYLIYRNINTLEEVIETYNHEKLGHKNVTEYLSHRLNDFAIGISGSRDVNLRKIMSEISKNYFGTSDIDSLSEDQKLVLGLETIANIAERGKENIKKEISIWQEIVAFVKSVLRELGLFDVYVGESDIKYLLLKAAKRSDNVKRTVISESNKKEVFSDVLNKVSEKISVPSFYLDEEKSYKILEKEYGDVAYMIRQKMPIAYMFPEALKFFINDKIPVKSHVNWFVENYGRDIERMFFSWMSSPHKKGGIKIKALSGKNFVNVYVYKKGEEYVTEIENESDSDKRTVVNLKYKKSFDNIYSYIENISSEEDIPSKFVNDVQNVLVHDGKLYRSSVDVSLYTAGASSIYGDGFYAIPGNAPVILDDKMFVTEGNLIIPENNKILPLPGYSSFPYGNVKNITYSDSEGTFAAVFSEAGEVIWKTENGRISKIVKIDENYARKKISSMYDSVQVLKDNTLYLKGEQNENLKFFMIDRISTVDVLDSAFISNFGNIREVRNRLILRTGLKNTTDKIKAVGDLYVVEEGNTKVKLGSDLKYVNRLILKNTDFVSGLGGLEVIESIRSSGKTLYVGSATNIKIIASENPDKTIVFLEGAPKLLWSANRFYIKGQGGILKSRHKTEALKKIPNLSLTEEYQVENLFRNVAKKYGKEIFGEKPLQETDVSLFYSILRKEVNSNKKNEIVQNIISYISPNVFAREFGRSDKSPNVYSYLVPESSVKKQEKNPVILLTRKNISPITVKDKKGNNVEVFLDDSGNIINYKTKEVLNEDEYVLNQFKIIEAIREGRGRKFLYQNSYVAEIIDYLGNYMVVGAELWNVGKKINVEDKNLLSLKSLHQSLKSEISSLLREDENDLSNVISDKDFICE